MGSLKLSGFAWTLLDRLIIIVGMILGLLDCWKCWIVRQLIHQKCRIGSSELLEWSDCHIIRLPELLDSWTVRFLDSQTVRLSEFSDCWTVELEMLDRLIRIVRMLRF